MKENTKEISLPQYLVMRETWNSDFPVQSIFDFMYLTGVRVGEALKVKAADVDLGKQTAHIQTEKSAKDPYRTVIFTPKEPLLLENVRLACEKSMGKGEVWRFDHRKKARTYIWEQARKVLGTTVHSLRHTHAIFCVRDLNYTIPELMAEFGWTRWDTAKHYVKYQTHESRLAKIKKFEEERK